MWFQNAGWFFLLGSGSDTGHTECLGTFALSLLFQDLQLLTKCCYGVLQISFSYQVGIADSHWMAKLSLVGGQTSQAVPSVRRPSHCAVLRVAQCPRQQLSVLLETETCAGGFGSSGVQVYRAQDLSLDIVSQIILLVIFHCVPLGLFFLVISLFIYWACTQGPSVVAFCILFIHIFKFWFWILSSIYILTIHYHWLLCETSFKKCLDCRLSACGTAYWSHVQSVTAE